MRQASSRASYLRLAAVVLLAFALLGFFKAAYGGVAAAPVPGSGLAWPAWLLILFVFTFLLGMVAVVAGLGGGVLFVPIVSAFFPFHLDFVRGAGLMVALAGSLSAAPGLLRRNLASLRLGLPMALVASIFSIFGAAVGLALPTYVIEITLGTAIVGIVIVMSRSSKSEFPLVPEPDRLGRMLGISGVYREASSGKSVSWHVHRTGRALVAFVGIGFMAGMFGLGAGWANIPVLNLMLGAPLKVSVGTSLFIISIADTAAAWVYLTRGAIIPLVAVPSIAGMMLGSKIGVRLLTVANPVFVKKFVMVFLLLAGLRALFKGFTGFTGS